MQDRTGLLAGEHDRQPPGAAGAFHLLEIRQLELEDLTVEKEQGVERLVLGGGGDIAFHGQVGQKGTNLVGSHGLRVAFAVKKDEAFHPIQIGLLGAEAVAFKTEDPTHLLQERYRFGLASARTVQYR